MTNLNMADVTAASMYGTLAVLDMTDLAQVSWTMYALVFVVWLAITSLIILIGLIGD